jgi:hypothetical protein
MGKWAYSSTHFLRQRGVGVSGHLYVQGTLVGGGRCLLYKELDNGFQTRSEDLREGRAVPLARLRTRFVRSWSDNCKPVFLSL